MEGHHDIAKIANGVLAGLVSITAGCHVMKGYCAIAVGFLLGVFYFFSSRFLQHVGIDDPLEACTVHGACGIWGIIATSLFHNNDFLLKVYSDSREEWRSELSDF